MQLLFPRQVGYAAATRPPFAPGQAARGIAPLHIRPVISKLRIACLPSSRWYAVDLRALDEKWQHAWRSRKPAHATVGERQDERPRKPTMVLPMFPYPSGSLHLGHLRVYTIADVVARYHKLKGCNVMLPIGWDAFGLPAENAALERGVPPADWTRTNIAKMKDQLQHMNASYNWDRELTTCDPSFYKHTQKLFLMLYERGLAYQAEAEVNYDPVDKTVLANEQVDARGRSWRSGALVEKKKMKQWFFRISDLRESLLQGLDDLARDSAWPACVLMQQRHWLGKSAGACIKFPVLSFGADVGAAIEVFTTRPDTLFGVQYLALSASHPAVARLAESDPELQAFLSTLPALPPDSKVGYLLPQLRAINPLAYHDETPDASKDSIPIYVAPYVLDDYGEGAVMGVPGHDLRDHSFWQTHQKYQPIRVVLAASEDESTTAMANTPFLEHGIMTDHSGMFKGKSSVEAGEMLLKMLEDANMAKRSERWRLRDWLVSRQRYWGTPIPIVHCGSCGVVPVPDEQLPVELPPVDEHWAKAKAGNALEASADFLETTCPRCGRSAQRETDTMDTFVDSSWYYARFADPDNVEQLVAPSSGRSLPVDIYVGGVEHAIMHLLYARFIYKFLASTPLLPQYSDATATSAEPFRRLITQGMVHGKTYSDPETGRFLRGEELDLSNVSAPKIASTGKEALVTFEKMSKSKHNGVDPGDCIAKHGADATRAHMLFQAPVGDVVNWDEVKIAGITRWLRKLHDLVSAAAASSPSSATQQTVMEYLESRYRKLPHLGSGETRQWDADVRLWRAVQRTVASVRKSLEEIYSLNTVVSDLMSLTNLLGSSEEASGLVRRQAASTMALLLAPITPAFAEECWSVLQPRAGSIFETASFPETDGSLGSAMLQPRQQACAVQVNGKTREVLKLPPPPAELEGDGLREWMVAAILRDAHGRERFGAGKYDVSKARRTIPVKGGRVINFVM